MTSFQSYHRASYPAISPTSPSRSQAGRTILIAGGSTGIGFNISRGFVAASASRLVLLGRREQQLQEARDKLLKEAKHDLDVIIQVCDMGKESDVTTMWQSLKQSGVDVHVLILNAATLSPPIESLTKNMDEVRSMYEFNLFANLRMTSAFLEQGPEKGKVNTHRSA
jgi:short-subunit dehydrogenase